MTYKMISPFDASAYLNRGAVWFHLDDYSAAIEDFDKAIQLNPNNALAYYDRAVTKKALGQQKAAEADFKKAKELDPNVGK